MKFLSASSFWTPELLVESAWHEHAPFAFWLTEFHRPHVVVELGAHYGFSYCCFCQAIERLGLEAKAFAIDTWRGDDHAGFYSDDVFQRLSAYHQRYSAFSQLVRSSFDEALPHFADSSIDLLHIDGRHFYEDVKHDFTSWVRKLSTRSIVLFHDTNVRERGFGVFEFWREISSNYPALEFFHGHGLGILGFGSEQRPELIEFFDAMAASRYATEVRRIYSRLGTSIAREARISGLERSIAEGEQRAAELVATLDERAARIADAQNTIAALEASVAEAERRAVELGATLDERAAQLTAAQSTITALEASVADAERRAAELGATLDERAAQRTDAQSTITALEASVADAERRAAELGATLDERAAQLTDAQSTITALEASVAEAERRAAELGATLDQRTAHLTGARERIASLEQSIADQDRELGRYAQRIAAIKASWSWRLMAPFREMYRPVRRLRASRVGVRLAAALRHPTNSRKRKQYRAKHMGELPPRLRRSGPHSRFAPKLGDLARDDRLRSAPSPAQLRLLRPDFDGMWYLERYADAALSGLDAHEHYLRVGYLDGRPSSPNMEARSPIAASLINLRRDEHPEVTIIIPVYKNFTDTLRCLHSISCDVNTRTKYQVIIADDCPSEPIAPYLDKATGLTIITNATNLGFLRNCNANAGHAEGDYIVFLNNDTVVTPGWLDSLVEIARRDPKVGMVGCKLLNPDGTVQEAGGVIFRNGWGYSYGRGDDPGKPEYNYVREVDCVTGACFLVRRDAFDAVGRFDDDFAPAFYEEFDLAFALAKAGYKVFYQPASEVYHLGSASYGAELRDHHSTINHAKFCMKWASRLEKHFDNEHFIFLAREQRHYKGMILAIDDYVPQYDRHAGALTMFQYIQLMVDEGLKVIFIPDQRVAHQPYTRVVQQMGVEVLHNAFDFDGWLNTVGPFLDWVWVARPDVAPKYLGLLREKTKAKLIYYTHDLHFVREMRRYEVTGDASALTESQRLRPIEIDIFRKVDCVTTPSFEEARIIAEIVPERAVQVLPAFFFRPSRTSGSMSLDDLSQRSGIIFVGGFDHQPNIDAAVVLVKGVMPLVWDVVPEARVLIVGNNPPPTVTALAEDRVEVTGYVPNVGPYYERSRLSLSPLRYGAGVKGKIIASLEAGIPVVTTSVGNEGIGLVPDIEALIGDTPAELAAHVVRLFKDTVLLRQLSEAGRRVVRDRFSVDCARSAFFSALNVEDRAIR